MVRLAGMRREWFFIAEVQTLSGTEMAPVTGFLATACGEVCWDRAGSVPVTDGVPQDASSCSSILRPPSTTSLVRFGRCLSSTDGPGPFSYLIFSLLASLLLRFSFVALPVFRRALLELGRGTQEMTAVEGG